MNTIDKVNEIHKVMQLHVRLYDLGLMTMRQVSDMADQLTAELAKINNEVRS